MHTEVCGRLLDRKATDYFVPFRYRIMRQRCNLQSICILLIFVQFLNAESTAVLINQALKGKVFGSPNSNDVAKRIVVGGDGAIYVAGETTPNKPDVVPWGDAEAGEATAKTDVFLAKFSTSGQLVWVKRFGSTGEDVLNDLILANGGLYLCGSTTGKLAIDPRGPADAFVMKFSLDGIKAWRHPFQFGSKRHDSCNSMHVDTNANIIYVTGTTTGKLFGSITPPNATSHSFVSSFSELLNDDIAGLQLIQGRQRGTHGNSSGEAIALSSNRVFQMTTEWEAMDKKHRAITYLNELEPETLVLRKLHMIKSSDEGSFQGRRMAAVNESGDIFIVGVTNLSGGRRDYHAVKFGLKEDNNVRGVLWVTKVGSVSTQAKLHIQVPSIVADKSHNVTYIAGVEDGYFTSDNAGVVIIPMYKLRMSNGEVAQRWHRSTTVPQDKEEVTDIALDPGKAVVYTGTWDGGPDLHANVLIGSFGSRGHTSRSPGSRPIASVQNTQNALMGEKEKKKAASTKVVGFVLLSLGGVGVVLAVAMAFQLRSSKRKIDLGDGDSYTDTENAMQEMRRQVAESHRQAAFSRGEPRDVVVGGSAGPC